MKTKRQEFKFVFVAVLFVGLLMPFDIIAGESKVVGNFGVKSLQSTTEWECETDKAGEQTCKCAGDDCEKYVNKAKVRAWKAESTKRLGYEPVWAEICCICTKGDFGVIICKGKCCIPSHK